MSEYIKKDDILSAAVEVEFLGRPRMMVSVAKIEQQPSIDIVRCQDCRKSHIDGKTTHYLWCTEWGRSTDVFGFCERGEREGE